MDKKVVVALTVMLLFSLTGVGAQEEPPAESRLRIAFIAKSYANPVFIAAHRGAQDAAQQLSSELGIAVEVLVLTPTGESPEQQAQRINMAVQQGAQAIAVAASDSAQVTKAIEEAAKKGVAVMTFDVDLPESRRFAYYGAENFRVGEMIIDELAQLIGGKGKVAVLAGNPTAPNLQRRVAGIKNGAKRHKGIKIVDVFHHVERPMDAAEELLSINEAHPDLKGWAMVGGWPLFQSQLSSAVLKDLKARNLKVVAVDALPEQLVYVDEGVAVLFAQPVYDWGTVTIKAIVDKLHLKKDVSGMIPMELVRVSREDLGEWARRLKDWGFEGVPEEYLGRE
jgi:ribose transport system substrate-binding protein